MLIRRAKPADAHAIAIAHVDAWREAYRGILPSAYLEALSYEERAARWLTILTGDEQSTFVVEDEEREVCGLASGGMDRGVAASGAAVDNQPFIGELFAIYLLHRCQRRGLGRVLITAVARALLDRGMTSMRVWVLARNPACAFYQGLGAVPSGVTTIEIGGETFDECAYTWSDLVSLAVHAPPEGKLSSPGTSGR